MNATWVRDTLTTYLQPYITDFVNDNKYLWNLDYIHYPLSYHKSIKPNYGYEYNNIDTHCFHHFFKSRGLSYDPRRRIRFTAEDSRRRTHYPAMCSIDGYLDAVWNLRIRTNYQHNNRSIYKNTCTNCVL